MNQPHALLLTGVEAAEAARERAQALLGEHVEYLKTVSPDEKGTISIEQIRELIAFFRLKVPGKAAIKRVAIIQSAESMGHEAQNALLKLLEEPPADSVLLLASKQPQNLLATIRSRVQILHLQSAEPAPDSEAVQLVKQALGSSAYERLLLVDGSLKDRQLAVTFVDALATVAAASMETAASKGGTVQRWQQVLTAAYTAETALQQSGNAKLVLTELMLAL